MSLDQSSRKYHGTKYGVGMLLVALASLGVARPVHAQSCILTRLDSPVLNAFDTEFNPAAEGQRWQLTFAWRYGYSFRHFVGTEEQKQRAEQHSQVVNNVNLADLSLRYNVSSRTSVTVGIPYLMARRSGPLRDENRVVIDRVLRSSNRGIGDISITGAKLLWDPATHRRSNISLGVGIKLPTGENSQQQVSTRLDEDGNRVRTFSTADISVQPGDGGFGIILQGSGYKLFNQAGSFAGYSTITYIVEPEDTSGVPTFRGAPGEEIASISDQYVARAGLQWGPASWNGWSVGLGGRAEGIPVHDLIGDSNGFRRPGYIASIEPSMTWTHNEHSVIVAVPWAVERNRERSVPDIRRGAHGDAAFPDYLILASYSIRF